MTVGIPPPFRNHRTPTASDTPASSAASVVVIPSPIASQNTTRSDRLATGGLPGDRHTGRPVNADAHPVALPIARLLDQALRRSVESAQYTSTDYTQVLDDHRVLASIGSVGDAYDNALSESFVDSYKTELIADRVWRTKAQLELRTVEYVSWFNNDRLHESLGDIPPVEFEALHAPKEPISLDGSFAGVSPRAAPGLRTRHVLLGTVDLVARPLDLSENTSGARRGSAQAATAAGQR